MKKKLQAFFWGFLLCSSLHLNAQDWHFSQFHAAPMMNNPALTGLFNGDMRLVANYRNQWNSAAKFNTFAASIDAPIVRFKNRDFISTGAQVIVDRAGDLDFTTTQGNLAVSYSKSLNGIGNHYLTAGFQAGITGRSVDFSNVVSFDTEPDALLQNDRFSYYDMSAGLNWYYFPDKHNFYYFGASLFHINEPNQSFLENESDILYQRYTVYGGSQFRLTEVFYLLPSFIYMNQGPNNELNIGTYARFKLNAYSTSSVATNSSFYIGTWYRVGDAIVLATRFDYESINIGLSYDINISAFREASNMQGGPEVSLIYILNSGKVSDRSGRGSIACPQFF